MKVLLALWLLALSGCATYRAENRILMCFGFCALQGVQLVKDGDNVALKVPVNSKCMAPTDLPK